MVRSKPLPATMVMVEDVTAVTWPDNVANRMSTLTAVVGLAELTVTLASSPITRAAKVSTVEPSVNVVEGVTVKVVVVPFERCSVNELVETAVTRP